MPDQPAKPSYLSHLVCTRCQRPFSASQVQTFCPDCKAPLLAGYDLETAHLQLDRDEISSRKPGMWRWAELLPVLNPIHRITLGEGDTPLLPAPRLSQELGLPYIYIKEESLNPTASFKARGLCAAVAKASELGLTRLIIPTAGNAGGALAAYAARAGLQACVTMPADTPLANQEETRIAGAEVILVEGLISDAARLASEKASREGWFDVSTFKEPYRVEGKKIMGYELAEAFGWKLPEVIFYPTGGGTGLVGMWKAFQELTALGWLDDTSQPRLVAVQASGCAPIVRAFNDKAESCIFFENAHTFASGLRVPKSFADREILAILYQSSGYAVAVSDEAIRAAQQQLARAEGIFAAPEGAATLAALLELKDTGWIKPEERVVLFNTSTGLKYLNA